MLQMILILMIFVKSHMQVPWHSFLLCFSPIQSFGIRRLKFNGFSGCFVIGLDILTWGTEGEQNPYFYPIYHYLWGGNLGHAALKLTLACDTYHDALIARYCASHLGETIIPHYRERGMWVVYFSWWPQRLSEEHEDRIEANEGLEVEYNSAWKPFFTQMMSPKIGLIQHKLGVVYKWLFGDASQIPKPIHEIIHPHPDAKVLELALKRQEALVLEKKEELAPLIESYNELHDLIDLLNFKLFWLNTHSKENQRQLEEAERLLTMLETELTPALSEHETLSKELKAIQRHFYQEVATVGVAPQRVHLSFDEALSPEKMLEKIRQIVDGDTPFDKITNNCSTVLREVIAAGLSPLLQTADCFWHLFDTPLKIHRFACQLQEKLINLRLEKAVTLGTKTHLAQYQGHVLLHEECQTSERTEIKLKPQ